MRASEIYCQRSDLLESIIIIIIIIINDSIYPAVRKQSFKDR